MALTGIEVILAALAAGASVGTGDAARAAVADAYAGLRDFLRRRLIGRPEAERTLDAPGADQERWPASLGDDLLAAGADRDEQILAAARRVLELVDPVGTQAGKYMDLSGARQPHVGDNNISIGASYGPTAGTMTGPVTVTYGSPPIPPARPAAG